jgi:hypothetical protein
MLRGSEADAHRRSRRERRRRDAALTRPSTPARSSSPNGNHLKARPYQRHKARRPKALTKGNARSAARSSRRATRAARPDPHEGQRAQRGPILTKGNARSAARSRPWALGLPLPTDPVFCPLPPPLPLPLPLPSAPDPDSVTSGLRTHRRTKRQAASNRDAPQGNPCTWRPHGEWGRKFFPRFDAPSASGYRPWPCRSKFVRFHWAAT